MKKRLLSIIICTVMVASLFSACGKKTSTSDSSSSGSEIKGKITFVGQNDQTGAVQNAVDSFKKAYPDVQVDYQKAPGASDDVKKSLMTSLAAGDSEPDVFQCDIAWVPQFASAGWLLDVTDELDKVKSDYLAGPLKTCYYNDKAYAFPDYTDVGLLYYRSDLIKTPPKTWDELVQMCKENIGKNGIEDGYVFQAFQGEPVSCNMLEFIKQNGGNDLVDGKFVIDSQNTVDALKFVRSLIDDKISPEGVLANKPDDSRAIFEAGKALFMRNWTYAYANAQSDTSKVKGKVGVTALPIGPNGTESSGTLGGWNFAINANSENKAAAVAFVKFMSSYDTQKQLTMTRSTFPTVAKVYDDKDVLAKLPYLASAKEAADKAKPRPQVKNYSAISTIFQTYFHKALTKDMPFEDAVKQMQVELNKELENQSK